MTASILVVEDDETIRETLSEVIAKQGHRVGRAADGASAVDLFRANKYDLVLLDLRLPDRNGLEVMATLRELDEGAMIIVMTAYPEVRTAVAALKAGAYDYLNKPFELDDLKELVRRALEIQKLRSEVERLRTLAPHPQSVEGFVGNDKLFVQMLEVTKKIAAAGRVPVLIRGESGTGKERVAQAIHNLSQRAAGPWVTLNCSAISEGLLESEMFGHEKGAFTDAKSSKRGLLELADGGTLFLDEIGDLASALQPKLLRAIETQHFRRVGGSRELQVDVRFVAATNRDIEGMVREGTFREDLYYRLNVATIDVPALRERRTDILPLARHFLGLAARTMGVSNVRLGPEVQPLLETYSWPGNVRELRNVLERALILSDGETITARHLPKELHAQGFPEKTILAAEPLNGTLMDMEKHYIKNVLDVCEGNKSEAARRLGISRLTLREKLKRYSINIDQEHCHD